MLNGVKKARKRAFFYICTCCLEDIRVNFKAAVSYAIKPPG